MLGICWAYIPLVLSNTTIHDWYAQWSDPIETVCTTFLITPRLFGNNGVEPNVNPCQYHSQRTTQTRTQIAASGAEEYIISDYPESLCVKWKLYGISMVTFSRWSRVSGGRIAAIVRIYEGIVVLLKQWSRYYNAIRMQLTSIYITWTPPSDHCETERTNVMHRARAHTIQNTTLPEGTPGDIDWSQASAPLAMFED
jgi:hypothetical protein